MSRKKRDSHGQSRRKGDPPPRPAAELPGEGPSSRPTPWPYFQRRTWVLAAAALAVVAAALVVIPGVRSALPVSGGVEFPPPPVHAESGPEWADFVGAEACAGCHAPQYEAWRQSTHGQAGGAPSPDILIARFDGKPIRFRDAVVTPSVTAGGEYVFRVAQEGLLEEIFQVDGVIGGGHMVGGGTQGFVSQFPDGTYRFLPFDFARREGTWFCNTNTRSDKGWIPITPDLRIAECGDWPPVRVLGDEPRFANCQSCHGSQIDVSFDPAEKRFETRFHSLAINCESCHGPGRPHIEMVRTGTAASGQEVGMRPLGLLSKDASLNVCFQCHAVKDVLEPGYLPGKSLEQHYSLKLPFLGDRPLLPDGRVRTFAYQENHLFSDCYLNGSMTCTSCHDPHSQGYRDINGARLESRFSNGQCTGCHASKAEPIEAHTFHPAESAGSQCVNCHMPYLQHPELGGSIRFSRSDHTIPVPRPLVDQALKIENACQTCHTDRPPEVLQRQITTWYGELKPQNVLVAGLLRAQQQRTDRGTTGQLVLRPEVDHPAAQVSGLSYLLEQHLSPDMPRLEPEIVERVRRLSESRDLDVRALALATLHLTQGEGRATRAFLAEQLRGLGEADPLIRSRWVTVLGFLGDSYRTQGRADEAVLTYRKALEVRPEDPRILHNLGLAHADKGDLDEAISLYQRVIRIDARFPGVQVNLGLALERQGNPAGAAAAYHAAMAANPYDAIAAFNLGNIFLNSRDPERAIPFYRRAAELDPGLALAHFHLARAYILTADYTRALAAVRRGLQFNAEDVSAQQMLRDLESVLANP